MTLALVVQSRNLPALIQPAVEPEKIRQSRAVLSTMHIATGHYDHVFCGGAGIVISGLGLESSDVDIDLDIARLARLQVAS